MHLEKQHCLCKVEEEGNNNVSWIKYLAFKRYIVTQR
jgi:hypothetical protein